MNSTCENSASLRLCAPVSKGRRPFSVSTVAASVRRAVRRAAAFALFAAAFAAAALAPLAAGAAVAAGQWTTTFSGGSWSSFKPSESSLLRPEYLACWDKTTDSRLGDKISLCDHESRRFDFYGNCTAEWNLPAKATITNVQVFVTWGDIGRDDVDITSISVKHSVDGEWELLENSEIHYKPAQEAGTTTQTYAGFAAADGVSALAEGVVAVQMVFPAQENGYVGMIELEALGFFEEDLPAKEEPELVWTAGLTAKADLEPLVASSNMLRRYASSIVHSKSASSDYSCLMDGDLTKSDANPRIYDDATTTFMLSKAVTLQSFRVFSHHPNGRDSISIWRLETLDSAGAWTERTGFDNIVSVGTDAAFDSDGNSEGPHYAILRRKDGAPIAEDVCGVRVYSYYEDSAGSNWSEVELEGWSAAAGSVFDDRSPTVTNDCWDVTWTASLSDLGASGVATLNLWTSLDNKDFTLTDTKTVTEADKAYEFNHAFADVDQTIWYRFETVNGKDGTEWRSTNAVAKTVNHDNATYFWKPSVASGAWEDKANWTNSRNDDRLTWPTDSYTTADFSQLAEGASVTVTVGAAHSPCIVSAPLGATLTLTGASGVTLSAAAFPSGVSGRLVVDAITLSALQSFASADGSRIVAQNGAAIVMKGASMTGAGSAIELLSGATLKNGGQHFYISNGSEIYLNGGEVTDAGYFWWSGKSDNPVAYVRFGPKGGVFNAPWSHNMYGADHLCTFRYELPGGRWAGYGQAPMRPTSVNSHHRFGYSGSYRVELSMAEGADAPLKELEIPLLDMGSNKDFPDGDTVKTNSFTFAAFGDEMTAGVPNAKGDYFYWTYDGGEAKEPATAGTNPTGLRFHQAKRTRGMVLTIR